MKARHFTISVAVLAAAMMAGAAFAQTQADAPAVKPMHFHGHRFGGPMGFPTRGLNLSDDQHTQMKSIMSKEKPTLSPLFKQMATTQSQIRQLSMSDNFDEGKVRELATQQQQTMTELTVQRARVQSELYQVLTADQKTKLTQMMLARQQRFQQHTQQAPAQNEQQN